MDDLSTYKTALYGNAKKVKSSNVLYDGPTLQCIQTSGSCVDLNTVLKRLCQTLDNPPEPSVSVQIFEDETTITITETSGMHVYLIDASAGAVVVDLPTAVGNTAMYVFKKIDSTGNPITIDPYLNQTADGSTTLTILYQYTRTSIVSDDSNWFIIE